MRSRMCAISQSMKVHFMTIEKTAPTIKPLSMAAIKSHASMADFYQRSIDASYSAAYEKGAAIEQLAATVAGCTIERAHSGNTNGLARIRAIVDNLTIAKKHARASLLRTVCAYVESVKPQSLKSSDIQEYADSADMHHAAILAILAPNITAKPKAPAVNWKQECLNARAERDALKAELDAIKGLPVSPMLVPAPF
jgi:hypothetical protein